MTNPTPKTNASEERSSELVFVAQAAELLGEPRLFDKPEELRALLRLKMLELEHYRGLLDQLGDAVFSIDANGAITFVSAPVQALTGFTPRALRGVDFRQHVLAEDHPNLERCFAKAAVASAQVFEFRYFNADGALRWGQASSTPILANEGHPSSSDSSIDAQGVLGMRGVFSDITQRKLNEQALHHRLRNEQMLSEVSRLAVTTPDLHRLHAECLALLGSTLNVSRAYVFEHREESGTMVNTHEWCAPGVEAQIEQLQAVPNALVPWWVETLASDQSICFSDIEDIPDRPSKIVLRPQGVLSILVVPLFVQESYAGFIGFDDCKTHREWPKEDLAVLRSISRLLGSVRENAMMRVAEREQGGG